jgi:5-methylcytosine-specific restriction protein A
MRKKRARILYRDRWTCRQCGAQATQVDHITPVLLGGVDDERNLQALCVGCNTSKGGGYRQRCTDRED